MVAPHRARHRRQAAAPQRVDGRRERADAAHGEWVVTSDLHLRLLAGTTGQDLRATGTVVRAGRRLTIVAIELLAADGTLVATATGAFCPTGKPLPPPGAPAHPETS